MMCLPAVRRALVAVALVAASLVASASPAAAAAPETFTFVGAGFGHGVGMSQYGAFGQAQQGRTSAQILEHYYTGAKVQARDDSQVLRVNLLSSVASAQVRGEPLEAGGSGGAVRVVAGGASIDAGPQEAISFSMSGAEVVATKGEQVLQGAVIQVEWSAGPTLLNVVGPGEDFATAGHRYRYGGLDLGVAANGLQVVNRVRLHDDYLKGIAEVPSSWPMEALKAQVIAARTYALFNYNAGERASCRCHLFDTVASQVFAGWAKEAGAGGSRWVEAVKATDTSATAGQVVVVDGAAIGAYYYSSSGGRTETNTDGFGSSTPVAYLKSVDDRWSMGSYNPFSSWRFTRSQDVVLEAFNRDLAPDRKLADVESVDFSSRSGGGSVKSVVATATDGGRATLTGATFRSRLDLPSRWIGTPVVRIAGNDRYATAVAIGKAAVTKTGGVVVIASGEPANLVDGLVAAPLAAVKDAPLLLSSRLALGGALSEEVGRRKFSEAILVGGTGALSSAIEDELKAKGVTNVRRLAGQDRFDTGLLVAREMGAPRTLAVIASGEAGHLVDALAAGGPAAAIERPILLVAHDFVPLPTRQALTELGTTQTIVAGGEVAVSAATMSQLPSPTRVAGDSRFTTAIAIADHFVEQVGINLVVIASGADHNLVDALPGGALGAITLLTAPSPLTPEVKTWLTSVPGSGAVAVDVLGGPAAVSDAAFDAVRAAVFP